MYPRNMVYFWCKTVNTLHNRDDDDDDDDDDNNNLKYIACFVEDIQHPEGFGYILQYISLVKICCLSGRRA